MLDKITKIWLFLLPIAFLTSMAAMELLSWTFFLLFLAHLGRDGKKLGLKSVFAGLKIKIDWAVWGFFLVVTVGAFTVVSKKQIDVIGDARWVVLLYAYAYVLKKYISSKWESYLPVISGVIAIIGAVALMQFLFGWDFTRKRDILAAFGSYYRASGFFNHPLTFAYSIGMAWLVMTSLALSYYKAQTFSRLTLCLVAASVLSGVGLITSLSRGAWGAGAVAVLIVIYQMNRKWALKSLVAMVLLAGVLAATNSTIQSRFNSLTTISKNESNRLRTVLWQANWEIFKDHPVIGVGLGHNRNYLMQYYEQMGMTGETIVSHAHNNYLQILAGTGTLGFLFYLSFCGFFIVLSWRLFRKLPQDQVFLKSLMLGIFAAQIFLHLGGLTQCNFTDGEVNHQLVFLWGLVLAVQSYELKTASENITHPLS